MHSVLSYTRCTGNTSSSPSCHRIYWTTAGKKSFCSNLHPCTSIHLSVCPSVSMSVTDLPISIWLQCTHALPDRSPHQSVWGKLLNETVHGYSNATKPVSRPGLSQTKPQGWTNITSQCVSVSVKQKVRSRGLEEVVILNVDTNTLETPFEDLKRIPSDVVINRLL